MSDLIRDSIIGGWINSLSGGKLLPYADQRPGYILPNQYTRHSSVFSPTATLTGTPPDLEKKELELAVPEPVHDAEQGGIPVTVDERWKEYSEELERKQAEDAAKHDFDLVDWSGPDDVDNPQ